MQVTDAMVDAALAALPAHLGAHEDITDSVRTAIQAALDAAPERDDFEPPPFVTVLTEDRLAALPADVADAVRDLLRSRTVWRNLGHRQGAELEQLRAERDARGHDLRIPVRIHVQVDEEAFTASIVAAVQGLPAVLPRDDQGRISIATLDDDLAPRTGGRVWLHTTKEPTVTDDAAKPSVPSLPVSVPTALGSFTVQLGADYNPMKLLSAGQIAGHLGVELAQVEEWIELGATIRFPEPLKRSIAGDRWQAGAIDQWYELWKASNGG